jgi:predicted O-methyltransferase YrrM
MKDWKKQLRFHYYSNSLVRRAVNFFGRLLRPEAYPPCEHLFMYREKDASGPVQRDEALFLLALVKVIRPQTVVEFGFSIGHSAFNFLQALDPESRLYSFDVADSSAEIARRYFCRWRNFRFIQKSQDSFSPSDIDGRQIDLVFIDAAHEIEINKRTFSAILPTLAPNAIICVHDTGTWLRSRMLPVQIKFAEGKPGDWINSDEFQHQKDERQFVNWIIKDYPFHALHFHTLRCIRHGTTLLARTAPLAT